MAETDLDVAVMNTTPAYLARVILDRWSLALVEELVDLLVAELPGNEGEPGDDAK